MTKPTSASFVALVARSLLFNVAFYLNLLLHMLVAIPTFVLPQPLMVQISRSWGATSLWLLRTICGIKVEWHGREKIPPGALLVAGRTSGLYWLVATMILALCGGVVGAWIFLVSSPEKGP